MEETPIHIHCDCVHVKSLCEKLQTKFQNDIILPSLRPQAANLGLTNEARTIYNLLNQILFVYRSREKQILDIDFLIDNQIQIQKKEKRRTLLATIKQIHTIENGALQITFFQRLDNMHYEKHTGSAGRRLLLSLCFVYIFSLICIIFLFLFLS